MKEDPGKKPANEAEPTKTTPLKDEALKQVAGGTGTSDPSPIQVEPFSTWEIIPTIDS